MKQTPKSLQAPNQNQLTGEDGKVSREWDVFFRDIQESLSALGVEKYFKLTNNQVAAANIEGLSFDYRKFSQVSVDYLIQRVTTGGGAQEKIESGTFYLVYKPTSNAWVLSGGPTTSGITLTITAAGQVQYTSTNLTGTASISKITFKARTLAAKNSQYSEPGR